jgi:hypothetical protein
MRRKNIVVKNTHQRKIKGLGVIMLGFRRERRCSKRTSRKWIMCQWAKQTCVDKGREIRGRGQKRLRHCALSSRCKIVVRKRCGIRQHAEQVKQRKSRPFPNKLLTSCAQMKTREVTQPTMSSAHMQERSAGVSLPQPKSCSGSLA